MGQRTQALLSEIKQTAGNINKEGGEGNVVSLPHGLHLIGEYQKILTALPLQSWDF